jgi:hypothetical protein
MIVNAEGRLNDFPRANLTRQVRPLPNEERQFRCLSLLRLFIRVSS